jgi:hypothetical protein
MRQRKEWTAFEELTLRDALDDLGWFYATFSSVVGGPSILSLLQMVFDHRLVEALQWIVDGYNQITATLAVWVEPAFAPLIAWVNETFDWELTLHAHWRPLFLLGMVMVVGRARGFFRDAPAEAVVVGATTALGALLGALSAGLLPLSGGPWIQGIAAAAPVAAIFMLMQIPIALWPSSKRIDELTGVKTTLRSRLRDFASTIGMTAAFSAIVFAIAAGISFVPGLSTGAGILMLAGLVLFIGVETLRGSLSKDSPSFAGARMGLIVIGGFLTAGFILIADLIIKWLS